MDFFNRTTPVYQRANASKVTQAQAAAPGRLSGLIGLLFGSASPIYKTVDGQGAKAPAPSGFWSMFAAPAPSYKTAPTASLAPMEPIDGACMDANGHGYQEACECVPASDEVVLL